MRTGVAPTLAVAALACAITAPGASAQSPLPVKIHAGILSVTGDGRSVIARTDAAEYLLYSAHKEAGRPWADAVFVRRDATGIAYLSRAYHCAQGTYRQMGEHRDITRMSETVTSIGQIGPRRVEPGSIEYQLARYACAL